MTKIVGIEKGKKPEEPCQFCGETPKCPGWTCSRLASVEVEADGSWRVEFVMTDVEIEFTPSMDDEPGINE
jgi:hypothetical protein